MEWLAMEAASKKGYNVDTTSSSINGATAIQLRWSNMGAGHDNLVVKG
jgi:hypothetical protein